MDGADAFYSVLEEAYQYFIALSLEKNIPIFSLEKLLSLSNSHSKAIYQDHDKNTSCCSFTFDDGHATNYSAACLLQEHGFSADFFVNSSTINTKNFLSSSQLKEMVSMGMSIQSHGHTHEFMNDLDDEALLDQLKRSKDLIGDACGREVTIFAPPGGRYDERLKAIAKSSGYSAISNSEPGYMNLDKVDLFSIPRVAVTSATSKDLYEQLLYCESAPIRKDQIKYFVTKQAKKILGNQRYEVIWKLLRG